MRDNGRYVYHPNTEYATEGMLIDSRTGTVFVMDLHTTGGASAEIHPQTGEMIFHKSWSAPAKK
jgi:hypothetical protein